MNEWINRRRQQQSGTVRRQAALVSPPPPAPRSAPLSAPPPAPVKRPGAPVYTTTNWLKRLQDNTDKPLSNLEEETARILQLPYIDPDLPRCPDPDAFGKSLLNPKTPNPDFKLRPKQIDSVWEYITLGGLLAPLGVGLGKTFITILCAVQAIKVRKHRRVVLMVPPGVMSQLIKNDLPEARAQLDLQGVRFLSVRGNKRERMMECKESGSGVWIYSYSSLSAPTGFEELRMIDATVYILDEAHCVSRATSARTKRLKTVWQEIRDQGFSNVNQLTGGDIHKIDVIPLSGTLTKKSIGDYAHLASAALGIHSPAPIRESAIRDYAAALDAKPGAPLSPPEMKVIRQISTWADETGLDSEELRRRADETEEEYQKRNGMTLTLQEEVRFAYRDRFNGSPGVVASSDQGVDASLLLQWSEPTAHDAGEKEMIRLMQRVVDDQLTPNGDVIEYAIHNFKWLWEISNGFYNSLEWPELEQIRDDYLRTSHKQISTSEAEALLMQSKRHHSLQQDYYKQLRKFLDWGHIPSCDTPMLVAGEIVRQIDGHKPNHVIPKDLIEAYTLQKAAKHDDLPERIRNQTRVCNYKIQAAMEWIEHEKEGLIWYHHPVIGNWLHESLINAGIEHTFAPRGENEKVLNKGIVIASYTHGTGKNLQHNQHKNLFLELRREANIMEQTIGRTHRAGQKADTVEGTLFIANYFDLAMFNGTLNDADYAQSTLGGKQRLCYATYNPVVPPTNARLMQRLGIIKNSATSMAIGNSWEQITPSDIEHVADFFRSNIYG